FAQGRVLIFAVAAAVICGMLFGLAPALSASRTQLAVAMKEGTREGTDRRSRLRSMLMVTQVALAVLLLTGAGLFVHSLRNVQATDPGFDVDHLVFAQLDLASVGFPDSMAGPFYERALGRVRALPGVASVTTTMSPPMDGNTYGMGYKIPGRTSTSDDESAITEFGGPAYFATIGTRILQGRDFSAADREGSLPVAIVNEAFANKYWPGESPIGKCISDLKICHVVVGVAANAKYVSITEQPREVFFIPVAQSDWARTGGALLIRTTGDPSAVITSVRRTLLAMRSNLPYPEVKTLEDIMRPELQPRRLGAAMIGVFGLLALVLAAIGLYGVISYAVTQRTREVGIRMALGAQQVHVVSLVVRQGALLTLVGLVIGIAAALGAARLITHLLFGVSATDPITFVGVAVLLAAVAALASYLPARRATRVDPMIALRAE
ncbi:MAG TPA: FtsX-like permease family protein, partial [Gemmatimonadaceae bacterium]|nr:FtsX-like permease family protein [Gemmatimonadaceae bacterium]